MFEYWVGLYLSWGVIGVLMIQLLDRDISKEKKILMKPVLFKKKSIKKINFVRPIFGPSLLQHTIGVNF